MYHACTTSHFIYSVHLIFRQRILHRFTVLALPFGGNILPVQGLIPAFYKEAYGEGRWATSYIMKDKYRGKVSDWRDIACVRDPYMNQNK